MSEPNLLVDIDARGVATVTLNRPAVRNAFDDRLITDLTAMLQRLGVPGAGMGPPGPRWIAELEGWLSAQQPRL